MIADPQSQKELKDFGYGFLGVLIFSLTLPATRIAVLGFDPVFVGLGRAIVAAGLSLNQCFLLEVRVFSNERSG